MPGGCGNGGIFSVTCTCPGMSSVPGPVSDSASPKARLPVSSAARAGAWAAAGK